MAEGRLAIADTVGSGRASPLRPHCAAVNSPLVGMRKVCSEDAVRRGLAKIGEAKGLPRLQNHLEYCTTPLLDEPGILDMDSKGKTLYGRDATFGLGGRRPGVAG